MLITAKAQDKFVQELKKAFDELYSKNPQKSTDYGRIINNRHFHRLSKVLHENKSGDIVIGGETDENDLYIAPTVIANVDRDDKLMEDELFGPLLPMIQVADVDDAIEYINSKDEPLALYIFSSNKKFANKVMDSTRSGAILVNDTLMHVAEGNLPFGGTGPSGMGSYHGKKSFDAFSHERSTMVKDLNVVSEAAMSVRYAPYNDTNLKVARMVLESVPRFKKSFVLKHFKWVVIALIFGIGLKRFA